jgi:hypothetical protein
MLTRALIDSHYGKPTVIARAFREPHTFPANPIVQLIGMPMTTNFAALTTLPYENSRLGRSKN